MTKQARIAEAMGHSGEDAADAVQNLIERLGLPSSLKAVGVERARFDLVATNALHARWVHTNPRKIGTKDDVLEILEMAAG